MAAELSSVLEVTPPDCLERYTIAGEQHQRSIPVPETHVRVVPSGMVRVYAGATGVLRLLVRALYLFPILLVVKIVLFALHSPASDLITVGFVVLVVALFGAFAFVVLLFAIVGPRSKRAAAGALVFRAPTKRDAEDVIARRLPRASVRVVGRVDAGLAPGEPVLAEHWGNSHGTLVRLFEGSSFVVTPDDGQAGPVVVALAACPIILARYERKDEPMAIPGIGAVESIASFVLRQGERVEVIAAAGRPGTHPLLHAGDALTPYREADASAMVVACDAAGDVVIRAF